MEYRDIEFKDNSSTIRVLLDEQKSSYNWVCENTVYLKDRFKNIALIKKGNLLQFTADGNKVKLSIRDNIYTSAYFQLVPVEENKINLKDKLYRGALRIGTLDGKIQVVNTVRLEEYLRGVVPAEMPVGKGTENYEALKAFSICARTYAFKHLNSSRNFDILADVRDQVYLGSLSERGISNKAILETKGYILSYKNKPAIVFYHSTCGGYTEDAAHVFSMKNVPYLQGIKDGDPSNCTISPRYQWQEVYSPYDFTSRFRTAGLIKGSNWLISNIEVKNIYESGRIKDIIFTFSDSVQTKKVTLSGDNIRSVIKNSSNNAILNSTMFSIVYNDSSIIITGKGYGHGVGMCQFGAINLSRNGKFYKSILDFYFPGTTVEKYYD